MREIGITVGIAGENETSTYQLSGKSCMPKNLSRNQNSQGSSSRSGSWVTLCIISMSLLFVASVIIVHLARRAKEGKDTMAELSPLLEVSSREESNGSDLGSYSENEESSSRRDSHMSWEGLKSTALDSESWEELMTKFGKQTSSLQIIDSSELDIIRQVAMGGYETNGA